MLLSTSVGTTITKERKSVFQMTLHFPYLAISLRTSHVRQPSPHRLLSGENILGKIQDL